MEYIKLTPENLEREHICCAISSNRDPQVTAKKSWLRDRLSEGLVFLKGDARGKCFIEYIPAEYAWTPISAEGYMHINCLWVSGSFKGHGYSNDLLDACILDAKAKGLSGLTVISSHKKMSFLSDPKYLLYKGFKTADTAPPYFTLMYLPFSDASPVPHFKDCVKCPPGELHGFTIYYTWGCPFTAKYVPILEKAAAERGIPLKSIQITSRQEAQSAPSPWTNFSLFYEGRLITHEILSEKKFISICDSKGEKL